MGLVLSNRINDVEKDEIKDKNCFICDLEVDNFVESIERYILNPDLLISHGNLSRKLVEDQKNTFTAKYYYDQFQKHCIVD